jgi:RNA polymerase sigma-54 factor
LDWQLRLSTSEELDLEIGRAIVGNIDDDGYLQASVDEICSMGDYPCSEVHKALRVVQSFDPIGVGARDLQECLLLQLRFFSYDISSLVEHL